MKLNLWARLENLALVFREGSSENTRRALIFWGIIAFILTTIVLYCKASEGLRIKYT